MSARMPSFRRHRHALAVRHIEEVVAGNPAEGLEGVGIVAAGLGEGRKVVDIVAAVLVLLDNTRPQLLHVEAGCMPFLLRYVIIIATVHAN